MRLVSLLLTLLTLAGVSVAQETNFSSGPQYLITTNSSMFLRPIATPTLSLSAPLGSMSEPAGEATPEPSSPFAPPFASAPPQPDLTQIFWGTPATAQPANENVSEIEITSAPLPRALPANVFDTGVTGMTSFQSLRERGFGVPLGESAAFWKTHKPHASRLYTNADIQRLHTS
jgi:hypothetical protein